ncbi:MAG: hypothetical protein ACRBBV_00860 [Paracoccaceae bacterium]
MNLPRPIRRIGYAFGAILAVVAVVGGLVLLQPKQDIAQHLVPVTRTQPSITSHQGKAPASPILEITVTLPNGAAWRFSQDDTAALRRAQFLCVAEQKGRIIALPHYRVIGPAPCPAEIPVMAD